MEPKRLLRRERALNDRECDGQLSFDDEEHAVIETCMARLDELNGEAS